MSCHKCTKVGHYARVCQNVLASSDSRVQEISQNLYIMGEVVDDKLSWHANVVVQCRGKQESVRFKLDTGASVTVLAEHEP